MSEGLNSMVCLERFERPTHALEGGEPLLVHLFSFNITIN